MHTVALEDAVTMRVTSSQRGIRLACNAEGLSVDHTNLVWKAASAVLEHARLSVGVDIELHKRVPMGAGLGGGSSDAAATILGLNQSLKLGWSREKMAEVGQALGSDVAFFLFAPSAIVSGRGESVRPVTIEGGRWIVLVKPAFGIETKWAYQELAATRAGVRQLSADHSELDRRDRITWGQVAARVENDFEMPVFARHPKLARDQALPAEARRSIRPPVRQRRDGLWALRRGVHGAACRGRAGAGRRAQSLCRSNLFRAAQHVIGFSPGSRTRLTSFPDFRYSSAS